MSDHPVQSLSDQLAALSPADRERHRVKHGAFAGGSSDPVMDMFAFFDADLIKAADVPAWRAKQQEEHSHG